MWGGGRARSSALAGMDTVERAHEILDQPLERQTKSRAPADQHVVISLSHLRRGKPHHLPQPPPHAIALRRVADLLGNGKSHPHWSILAPIERLQHESADGGSSAGRGGQEVCALPEPLQGTSSGTSLIRPLANAVVGARVRR